MTVTVQTPPYTLGPDEKAVQVMAYTSNAVYWGEVVVKEIIRVSTWLRTNTAPDRVPMYNARAFLTAAAQQPQARPLQFSELHVPSSQINAFHIVPPAKDPLDYDPTEPNRRMLPVSLLVSNFRMDGHLRLAAQTGLVNFLASSRDTFLSVYDAQISSPVMPNFRTITVPFLLIRQGATVFARV